MALTVIMINIVAKTLENLPVPIRRKLTAIVYRNRYFYVFRRLRHYFYNKEYYRLADICNRADNVTSYLYNHLYVL